MNTRWRPSNNQKGSTYVLEPCLNWINYKPDRNCSNCGYRCLNYENPHYNRIHLKQEERNEDTKIHNDKSCNHIFCTYLTIIIAVQSCISNFLNNVVNGEKIADENKIDENGEKNVFDSDEEISNKTVKDIVSQECEDNSQSTDTHKDYFADEDKCTFFWFMNWVDVIPCSKVIFKTVPTELMATRTSHMRTPSCLFNGNLAFWAFVCQKEKINKTNKTFEVPTCRRDKNCITFWTFLL